MSPRANSGFQLVDHARTDDPKVRQKLTGRVLQPPRYLTFGRRWDEFTSNEHAAYVAGYVANVVRRLAPALATDLFPHDADDRSPYMWGEGSIRAEAARRFQAEMTSGEFPVGAGVWISTGTDEEQLYDIQPYVTDSGTVSRIAYTGSPGNGRRRRRFTVDEYVADCAF